jgi:acetoin utilization protein AcuC
MATATDLRLVVVHDDGLGMRYGADHPMDGRRHRLAVSLARHAGVFDRDDVELTGAPDPMDDEGLHRVFAPAFVKAVRRYSATPALAAEPVARQWGIGGDNTAYEGMHEDSARVVATCALAASRVGRGDTPYAFVPSGGSHHGLSNRAWGFGLYNETAMAVQTLRDAGAERVAYIDLDVHHGNGTQWIFYENPNVLTVSVHESGRHLFPGSGFANETGGPGAEGSSVNVALPPFCGDEAYRRAFVEVVAPVVRSFRPDTIVAQCGVDHHHADPLSHLLTTLPLYPELWSGLRALADDTSGRLVALGGGGYDPCNAPPRAWALLMGELSGQRIPNETPTEWATEAVGLNCPEPPGEVLGDGPVDPPTAAVAAQVDQALAETRAAISRFWPLP